MSYAIICKNKGVLHHMDIIKLRANMLREGKIYDIKKNLISQFHDMDFKLTNLLEIQHEEIQKIKLCTSENLVAQFLDFFEQNNFEIKQGDRSYCIYPDLGSSSFIEFILLDHFSYELRMNRKIYTLQLKQSLSTSKDGSMNLLEPLDMDAAFDLLVNPTSSLKTMKDIIGKLNLYLNNLQYNHEILKTTPYVVSYFIDEVNTKEYTTFVDMFKSSNEVVKETFSPIVARLGISKIKTELDLLSLMCLQDQV